jgi:hypothetical protein
VGATAVPQSPHTPRLLDPQIVGPPDPLPSP